MENGETSDHCSFTFDKEFHEIVSDKQVLHRTLEKFLNNMIDEITLGIIFDEHRKAKINGFNTNGDDAPITAEQHDLILQQNCKRSTELFDCPNCDKLVASTKFAPHLEKCMGMVPRGRLRKSARRSTSTSSSKERESPAPYTSLTSDDDDDDDAEWKPGKKGSGGRRRERSRSKKRRGSRKGSDSSESVDVDGDDDSESTTSSLSDFRPEYTNGLLSSPTNSTGSSDISEKKKRDPSKAKKNNKNRSYPNSLCEGE